MSKSKRTTFVLSMVAVVLVCCITVVGTLAYLTSVTGEVTNTFTVGKVAITLDEAKTNEYGETVDANGNKVALAAAPRVQANTYKLLPGHNYTKDPTVHVQPDSEACYVFVYVNDGIADIEDETTVAAQIAAKGWTALDGVDGVYWKAQDAIASDADPVDLIVFETFTIKGDAAVANYTEAKIVVKAYAVQQDGMKSAKDAWTKAGFTVPTASGN